MKMKSVNRAAVSVALMCGAVPAQAADVSFSGSVIANSNAGNNALCPTGFFNTFVSPTTGNGSPLGSFTYQSDVCQKPGSPISGTFSIVLGDGSFSGTQTGLATPVPGQVGIPTLFNLLLNYTITSGTGAYAGATGSFIGTGTANNGVSPTVLTLEFKAVPEPATWAMMLVGFAGIGMAMRRSRVRAMLQVA